VRTDSFLVIIPAFNEEKNIGRVLKPLREENLPVLVVDDVLLIEQHGLHLMRGFC